MTGSLKVKLIAGLAATAMAGAPERLLAADQAWPAQVTATYKILFAGFEIGKFHFQSSINGSSYTAAGSAQLSAMLGAFKWNGASQASGIVGADAPKPAAFAFDFKSNSKAGSVKMSFADAAVTKLTIDPPPTPNKDTIPLQPQHLKDVLDPLGAMMALSRHRSASPCGRRLSIFDGKHRFDLNFSFRRQMRVAEARPSGQPGIATVCHVRYVPIAGHKNNNDTRNMASNAGIEVALRPVPSANLDVPYQVTIPTVAGTATLIAERVEIVTSTNNRIALVH